MQKDSVYPSKYLKASDLNGRDVKVRIHSTEAVALQGKPSLLIYFEGKSKPLVVKPTIWDQIEKVTGEADSDGWVGCEITLFPTETEFANQIYDVIRVRTSKPPTNGARRPTHDDIPADPDDDIPF